MRSKTAKSYHFEIDDLADRARSQQSSRQILITFTDKRDIDVEIFRESKNAYLYFVSYSQPHGTESLMEILNEAMERIPEMEPIPGGYESITDQSARVVLELSRSLKEDIASISIQPYIAKDFIGTRDNLEYRKITKQTDVAKNTSRITATRRTRFW